VASVVAVLAVQAVVAFGLTNLGLMIAWRMESTQGFHAIMNLILLPIWLLSGAFFPATGASPWLVWIMKIDPLTYGMAALRRTLYLDQPGLVGTLPGLFPSTVVIVVFAAATFWCAVLTARRTAQ
jgi:ABC-2 type transport system permease protein